MSSHEYAEPPARREPRGRGWIAGAFVLLVLAFLYFGAALFFGDKVPSGTTVGGVNVGGMTEDEAREAIERDLADDEARELTINGSEESFSVAPADAGLAYDYEGSIDGLTGFSANPVDLVRHVSGGTDHQVETTIDHETLRATVDEGAATLESEAVEGKVTLEGAEVEVKKSQEGLEVDRDALIASIEDGWPRSVEYRAPESAVEPTLAQDEIERFVEEDLTPLVSGPVTITTTDPTRSGSKDVEYEVSTEALAEAVSIKNADGTLSATISDKTIEEAVLAAGRSSDTLRAATDASVERTGTRRFEVIPAKNGLTLKTDSIAEPVKEAMTKEGSKRTAEVTSEAAKPELSTTQARRTVPKEVISTFSTTLTDDAERTENIDTAARTLDGTYVGPGESFSLNDVLGERTAAKGYNEAPVILNGRLRMDYGGGISQLSTTLFNAVFFSGAKIEEFHPHSFYISRYPEGREATISWPDVDNRFTNDTGAGILIEAEVSGGEVTVTFFGQKKWDIEAVKGDRRNVTQPDRIVDDSEGCVPQAASPGFDVTVTRIFKEGGSEEKRSSFTTTYIPEDEVICR
ncbi:VanW family protein [Janibacter alkaliphilus]|uniref:Vancomycin resistance protein YoaR n=1 Tax=Janibacter alkaliphilus TaxID=1069963 RepID=A0A852X4D7_9MICO|nr:VanW family protein [Janibacter alkaliphilus]NYG37288.1 vancomycin resistance protein YoaR [Janibacter alkaliphilus]